MCYKKLTFLILILLFNIKLYGQLPCSSFVKKQIWEEGYISYSTKKLSFYNQNWIYFINYNEDILFKINYYDTTKCIPLRCRVVVEFSDYTTLELTPIGLAGCDGQLTIVFSKKLNNFPQLDILKNKSISSINIYTYPNEYLSDKIFFTSEELKNDFKNSISCLIKEMSL